MGSVFVWGSSSGGLGLEAPEGWVEGDKAWCLWSPQAVEVGGSKVVSCACGDFHTLCVTEFGEVVSFGAVRPRRGATMKNVDAGRNREGQLGRESIERVGRVAGLEDEVAASAACGSQHSVVVTKAGRLYEFGLSGLAGGAFETATEQETTTTAGAAPARELRGGRRDAVLDRIVRESTERWLVAEDVTTTEADAGLLARAGTLSEEERSATLGMARMDFRRVAVRVPRLAASLAREVVLEAACGYAHTLARVAGGRAFASGYNDRGQLGLNHRVNLDHFERVRALEGRHVEALAAGSQHSMAVAESELYCWGQGALGQLGLGRRVTGRLSPVKVSLRDDCGEPVDRKVRAIAAGANHSIALDSTGRAYVFGHVEYNQHGGGGSAIRDYVAAEYYYVPRRVAAHQTLTNVACGANFTLGAAATGLVSWGWPAHGVLGRRSSLATDYVDGFNLDSQTQVLSVAAGARHAAAVVSDERCAHGHRLRPLLSRSSNGKDVALVVCGDAGAAVEAHACVLAARSRYFKGLLDARRRARECDAPIVLFAQGLTVPMLRSVVNYLYTDRLEAPPHRLSQLACLADSTFLLPDLAALCRAESPSSTFARDLANFVGDDFASDISLRLADGSEIPAHRTLLETADYFAALLRFHHKDIVDVGLGPRCVAQSILKFIYGGHEAVPIGDLEHLFDLVVAADLVQLPDLLRFCESALVAKLLSARGRGEAPERDDGDLSSSNKGFATACLEFATTYDFCTRLKRAATDALLGGAA